MTNIIAFFDVTGESGLVEAADKVENWLRSRLPLITPRDCSSRILEYVKQGSHGRIFNARQGMVVNALITYNGPTARLADVPLWMADGLKRTPDGINLLHIVLPGGIFRGEWD